MSNYIYENHNSKGFYNMAFIAFGLSMIGMIAGLAYLEADFAMKGFLAVSYLFTISSCLTVAKVVRDKHETDKFINKIETAKTEKFLNENTPNLETV